MPWKVGPLRERAYPAKVVVARTRRERQRAKNFCVVHAIESFKGIVLTKPRRELESFRIVVFAFSHRKLVPRAPDARAFSSGNNRYQYSQSTIEVAR